VGKAKISESQIQQGIVGLLSSLSRQNNFAFFSVPNERLLKGLTKKQAIIRIQHLKKMGMIPGCSDLVIVHKEIAYFVEVKTPTGKQSDNQHNFMIWVNACGCPYVIVRSPADMIRALKGWEIVR